MSLVVPFEEIFSDETGLIAKHGTWTRVPLGEVCSVINGYPFKSSLFNTTKGFPVIRIRDLSRNRTETLFDGEIPREALIDNGDLLIGMDGIFGCYEWSGGPAALNQRVCKIIPNERFLDKRFLLFAVNGYLKKIQENTSSVTVGHLSSIDILRIPLALPPRNEQGRITEKLEKLLAEVEQCKVRMAKIPVLLKRFRQSVLAAACSGRLTADWRDDDASERDLPASWNYLRLETLLPAGGIFDGPFGSNLKTSDYTDSGVRVIRLENIGHLRFIGEKETYISHKKYQSLTKHTVGEGDIIFASFIDEEIRVCVLPELTTLAIAKADCFCLRPKPELVDRRYLTYQLASRESYDVLFEDVHGATRPRINTTQLRKLEVRVCSLAEQQEIVRRVEALFALADRIEERHQGAKKQVDGLTQSILAKAFRGELVSTEAELAAREGRDYESAEALLQRIHSLKIDKPEPKGASRNRLRRRDG